MNNRMLQARIGRTLNMLDEMLLAKLAADLVISEVRRDLLEFREDLGRHVFEDKKRLRDPKPVPGKWSPEVASFDGSRQVASESARVKTSAAALGKPKSVKRVPKRVRLEKTLGRPCNTCHAGIGKPCVYVLDSHHGAKGEVKLHFCKSRSGVDSLEQPGPGVDLDVYVKRGAAR